MCISGMYKQHSLSLWQKIGRLVNAYIPHKRRNTLDEFIQWLGANKEWIFSGVGVVFVAWIWRVIFKGKRASSQEIRSGDKSSNIQAGRDIRIETKSKRADVEKS